MEHFKTIEVPAVAATSRRKLIKTTCDKCGDEIPTDTRWDPKRHAPEDTESEVTIKFVRGIQYPECVSLAVLEFDCCAQCWSNYIIPLFPRPARQRMIED